MNAGASDLLSAAAAIFGIWMFGLRTVQLQLRGLALQSAMIGLLCFRLAEGNETWHYYALGLVILGVKTTAIPLFLSWAAKQLNVQDDPGYFVGPAISLGLAFVALVLGLVVGRQLGAPLAQAENAAGLGVALIFMGLLLMITRRLALSQIVGFLALENGILLYGLTQTKGMPLMIEMGAAFEILVAVLIAGLIIFRLNRSFEHIDVADMRELQR